jgi:hypothetical protein
VFDAVQVDEQAKALREHQGISILTVVDVAAQRFSDSLDMSDVSW